MSTSTERTVTEIESEQSHVSRLYARLDQMRDQATERQSSALLSTPGGTQQARSERDSLTARYSDQLATYEAVEQGLCFGRLDLAPTAEYPDGVARYVGRIGIFDEEGDFEPLLMDWRAPASRPFYTATAASPDGVRRRRHLRTRGRTVVGFDDEVLDLAAAEAGREGLTGEAALLAAITAGRTGRMRDIVETIQAEQDKVIRADLSGVLVVQGGPGTGKTAVALHRAAYLLYTYREQLSKRAVLIVGPNATFLRYISQVLPSLAETGVLLATLGDLFPGIRARRAEDDRAAEIKGRAGMVEILGRAVRERQRVPDEILEVAFDSEVLELRPETVERARARARRSGRLHNLAQPIFFEEIVTALAEQIAEKIGHDPFAEDPLGEDDLPETDNYFDEADLAEIRRELRGSRGVRAAVQELWPILTPQVLLRDLFADPDRLAAAAPELTDDERKLLHRERGSGGWSPADVPLLDEAVEILGEDRSAERVAVQRRDQEARDYAEGVRDILLGSRSQNAETVEASELLLATTLLNTEELADRAAVRDNRSAAERAAADRTWAFGHVIVDEAQELSPMAWRLLMRRCPSRSMTIVGDVAQTGALAGTSSWGTVLEPFVGNRWKGEELTVSYRTPSEIMAVAARVLAEIDPALEAPRSVRDSGVTPWIRSVSDVDAELPSLVLREASAVGEGRVGVLVPAGQVEPLAAAVRAVVPDVAVGDAADLESRVVVLTVRQSKGLEFDTVLVVEPADLILESVRGLSDLYVALTRATQRMGILHTGPLPPALA